MLKNRSLTVLCLACLSWGLSAVPLFAQEDSSAESGDTSAAEADLPEAEVADDEAVESESLEAGPSLLVSEFSIFYQITHQDFRQGDFAISDWRENQLKATGQILFDTGWLLSGTILGSRSELDLPNFNSNPVFSFDSFGAEVTASKIWYIAPGLEIASGLSYLYAHYTPDNLDQSNQPIPYTNSALDYETTSHGPGLYAIAAYQVFDKLSVLANLGLYPYLFNGVEKGVAIPYSGLGRGQIQLRYNIVNGFLVNGFVNQDLWFGSYSQSNTTLGIGLTLVPGQISEQ